MDTVTLTRDEYQDLIDARDHAITMREVEAGIVEMIPDSDVDAYLAAPSPMAFWRERRGLTQAALAQAADISQAFLSQMESGKRTGTVDVLARVARSLSVRIEDLLTD